MKKTIGLNIASIISYISIHVDFQTKICIFRVTAVLTDLFFDLLRHYPLKLHLETLDTFLGYLYLLLVILLVIVQNYLEKNCC